MYTVKKIPVKLRAGAGSKDSSHTLLKKCLCPSFCAEDMGSYCRKCMGSYRKFANRWARTVRIW